MSNRTTALLSRIPRVEILAALAISAALAVHAFRPQAPAADPSRIATIDLEKTYNSIERFAAAQASIKASNDELEKKVKEAETTVKDLEAELESFQPGSDAQAAAIQKLQIAVGEFRAVQEFARAKLELERARALRDTYLAIKDAARRFAERDGYDYILLDDSLPEMDLKNASQTMQQISARRFIFATPKADVTNALIAFMNDEWKASKSG
ncbi:MAG: OmpH family outer membrane protein [bacterium]|jgi:Skp family chaperone for outer membrane proteins